MRNYKADLHIHSVLSPCGGLEMSPKALIKRIKELNIEWIAITDHNSMANCHAYAKVAEESGVVFTYGVEIQTSEEIHLLAYFDDIEQAQIFDGLLYDALPSIKNDRDFFGDQVVIDSEENILRIEERALSNSIIWSIEEAIFIIEKYNGLCVPAHIDAQVNSIISQLGFITEEMKFPILSITAGLDVDVFVSKFPKYGHYSFLRASDAHYLSDLGSGYSILTVEKPTIKEMVLAAQKTDNRKIVV